MEDVFKITKNNNSSISIQKNSVDFSIDTRIDDDIFFTATDELEMNINCYSRNNPQERLCFIIFESLIKSIFGRFILKDYNNDYSDLPGDFINLDTKTIIWHSDSNIEDTLILTFHNDYISIKLTKDKLRQKNSKQISIRIRTNGSEYGNYYEEFQAFFAKLINIAPSYIKKPNENLLLKKDGN